MTREQRDQLIVELRAQGDLSLAQIGARVGLSGTRVSRILNGVGTPLNPEGMPARSLAAVATREAVEEKLAREIEELRSDVKRFRTELPKAQREYDRAWDAASKIDPEKELPPKVAQRVETASRTLGGLYDTISERERRIARLSDPRELERRVGVRERLDDLKARKQGEEEDE